MDEREQTTTTTTHPIKSNNCKARELRLARVDSKFRLLDASNDDIVAGEEIVELGSRVPYAITVPAYDAFRRRRRRSRVWVNAPNGEEEKDEKTRTEVGEEEKERDKPVKFYQQHHTGLVPLCEKGDVGRFGCDFVHSVVW